MLGRLLMVIAASFIMRQIGHLIEDRGGMDSSAALVLSHNKLWPRIFCFFPPFIVLGLEERLKLRFPLLPARMTFGQGLA